MKRTWGSSDAGVVDVLYAVALGEGFFVAVNGIKEGLAAGQFALFDASGQTLFRVLIGFLIIILSWLFYRKAFLASEREYPTSEFAIDIVTMIAYMALLSFADWPAAFYLIVTIIWMIYLLARVASRRMNSPYFVFGLVFVLYFLGVSLSTLVVQGITGEWVRIGLVSLGVVAYRPLDAKLRTRLQID